MTRRLVSVQIRDQISEDVDDFSSNGHETGPEPHQSSVSENVVSKQKQRNAKPKHSDKPPIRSKEAPKQAQKVSSGEKPSASSKKGDGFCTASKLPTKTNSATLHKVTTAEEIEKEKGYQKDHWGVVEFDDVPKYHINTHDPVEQDIYISGSVHRGERWDNFVMSVFVGVLKGKKGMKVIDIGSNIGYYALLSAAYGHDVILFEPMARNMAKILSSVKKNGFEDRITAYHNALSFIPGHASLKATHHTNQGNGRIVNGGESSGRYGIDYVDVVTLDGVVKWDKVDLMKIDVEGFEDMVMNGARDLLCSRKVSMIMIEFSKDERNSACDSRKMLEFMKGCGYMISDIAPPPPEHAPELSIENMGSFPPNLLFRLNE